MSEYTLIASIQSTRVLYTLFWSQMFGVFDSDLAVNYVTFGSDQQQLVGNPNGRHDVAAAPCSGSSILSMSTVTFLPIAVNLELKYCTSSESQRNVDSNDVSSIRKYYQLFTHEVATLSTNFKD